MSLLDAITGAGGASLTPNTDAARMRIPFVVELRQTSYLKPTPDALARDILTQVGFTGADIAAFNRAQGFDVQRFLADGIKQGGIDCAALMRNADHPNGAAQVSLMKGNLERLQTFLTERRAAQTPTATASERQAYNTAEQRRAAVEAKLPPPPPPSPVKADNQESVGAFFEGALVGDFSDNDSWSATAGKIIGGLTPIADVRDIAAGITHVAQGKDGAGFELGASLLGAIPVVGDAGKAILRGGRKVATEVASGTAERAAKEAAERTAKETTERAVGEAASVALRSTPELRQGFRALLGEARYAEYAQEIERVKAMRPELKDIPTEDLIAIRGYTSQDYEFLNPALRNNNAAELKRLEPYIVCAKSGLNQLPSFKGTVYRGTDLTPEQAAQYVQGSLRIEPSFFSTASEAKAAFRGNTRYVIESVAGKDVAVLSELPHEREILFPPGTQFRVLSVDIDSSGARRIVMREIPKGASNE